MKHPDVEEPVVTMPDSRGATTTWSLRRDDHALTLDHPLARRGHPRSRACDRVRGDTTTRSRSITRSRGATAGGATTTVGWVTIYCGVNGPNGGAGTA